MFTYLLQAGIVLVCGSSSIGRASASQAEGSEIVARLPLKLLSV